ncbi:hypothetical protein [Stenotrophomonas sp. Marseille-Q4652]|uniref:hypothetical protein n=1 Tax=Stenotrophomonas sp. Marseille-Q4652 TaxID=2866595 RepID=UPI001CE4524D|nr:hypothetical protein [Stenotrophomonas sp. Marseille-Q4652]
MNQGVRVAAVRAYRQHTGTSLLEAHRIIAQWAQGLSGPASHTIEHRQAGGGMGLFELKGEGMKRNLPGPIGVGVAVGSMPMGVPVDIALGLGGKPG